MEKFAHDLTLIFYKGTLKDSIIVVVTIIDIGGVLVVVLVVLGVVFSVLVAVVACHYSYYH